MKLKQGANWIKSNENKTNKYVEKKGKKEKKERVDMQSEIEVDKGDLFTLKINCKGIRTVGKANKQISVEKIIIGLKN